MSAPVRIPANVNLQDKIIGPFTARQAAILAAAGALLYLLWTLIQAVVPVLVFIAAAVPLAAAAVILVMGERDGLALDRLLTAAIRLRMSPRLLVAGSGGAIPPPAWFTSSMSTAGGESMPEPRGAALRLPPESVTEGEAGGSGVVELGSDGIAVIAAVSALHLQLHTPEEQDALTAVFAQYLHSLQAPVQIVARTQPVDITVQLAELLAQAETLDSALAAAAYDHYVFLAGLARDNQLLRKQFLLVFREPLIALTADGPSPVATAFASLTSVFSRRPGAGQMKTALRTAAETRIARRVSDAAALLGPAGLTVTALTGAEATTVLTGMCNPGGPPLPTADLTPAASAVVRQDKP